MTDDLERGLGWLPSREDARDWGSSVKHHLANARSKVGAETTAQLVWILAPRLPEPEEVPEIGRVAAWPTRAWGSGITVRARPVWEGPPVRLSSWRLASSGRADVVVDPEQVLRVVPALDPGEAG